MTARRINEFFSFLGGGGGESFTADYWSNFHVNCPNVPKFSKGESRATLMILRLPSMAVYGYRQLQLIFATISHQFREVWGHFRMTVKAAYHYPPASLHISPSPSPQIPYISVMEMNPSFASFEKRPTYFSVGLPGLRRNKEFSKQKEEIYCLGLSMFAYHVQVKH